MESEERKEMLFWTKEEYKKFADEMMDKPVSYYAFQMLYWCGIREGELLALTAADFNFDKETVTINKSYQRLHGEDVITSPKTKKSNRTIKMPKFLCEEMQEYISIKNVYHKLFDKALQRYNEKQTRADRRIADYYEKIRNSKQEKPFHELILQIGDKENMGAGSENGQLARQILDEYYHGFQERNPNLYVFSAHIHMDEATPHLHIDFVPFTTGSKRGLDARVSLKQALAAQGFKGGSRGDTEWNQWVQSEKEHLAAVMERYGIEWEHKGTHEKHLSVLDYKKQEREKEVVQLEGQISEKKRNFKHCRIGWRITTKAWKT